MGESPPPRRSGRLLVVENDGPLRDLLCGALEDEGYQVGWSAEALATTQMAALEIDGLVLDVGRDGPEAVVSYLQALRASAETAGLPVIVIADDAAEAREEWQALAAGILAKPFDLEALFAVTAAALEGGAHWQAGKQRRD
jgi:DNA-binding response OmpR family regulator